MFGIEDLIVNNIIVPENYCMPRTREQPKAIFSQALCSMSRFQYRDRWLIANVGEIS